jgi:hypothetical protein
MSDNHWIIMADILARCQIQMPAAVKPHMHMAITESYTGNMIYLESREKKMAENQDLDKREKKEVENVWSIVQLSVTTCLSA